MSDTMRGSRRMRSCTALGRVAARCSRLACRGPMVCSLPGCAFFASCRWRLNQCVFCRSPTSTPHTA
eukprot:4225223-Heterocapsa_arctica.AAC.1